AAQVKFEWDNASQVWDKVEEEIGELKDAIASNNKSKIEEEFGDLVFSLINYARFLHIDAEHSLELTNKKFIKRFIQMENMASLQGKKLTDMSLHEMDVIWNSVKKQNQQD
ncbi:MAG: nucleoside triphosphate pyrophosphohydrolase, partial [Bacteroidetes bacterium]|nr:nucleoside triphosphate pyrophosphohydrolase [Bacteroidota bacterium]